MALNVTNELILEHLKAIQARMVTMASDISDVKTDLRSVKGHMASFLQAEIAQDDTLASMQSRLDRIEQSMNLQDGT